MTENHNHITRNLQPPGQCYSCDRYHAITLEHEVKDLRYIIYRALKDWDHLGPDGVHRYLERSARVKNIDRRDS